MIKLCSDCGYWTEIDAVSGDVFCDIKGRFVPFLKTGCNSWNDILGVVKDYGGEKSSE